ncbi:MAG: hypothetical protein KAS02_02085 [Candidatus Pacebacteria bacterium]|nr:hypothetical protein [Candidatus Paceibacterota bacterium]
MINTVRVRSDLPHWEIPSRIYHDFDYGKEILAKLPSEWGIVIGDRILCSRHLIEEEALVIDLRPEGFYIKKIR